MRLSLFCIVSYGSVTPFAESSGLWSFVQPMKIEKPLIPLFSGDAAIINRCVKRYCKRMQVSHRLVMCPFTPNGTLLHVPLELKPFRTSVALVLACAYRMMTDKKLETPWWTNDSLPSLEKRVILAQTVR